MEQRLAFENFTEKRPQFPPTFKFEEGTSQYDLKRRPAWCDRILYSVNPGHTRSKVKPHAEQISYMSHPTYSISDHKPVSSEFTIKVDTLVEELTVTFEPIDVWRVGHEVEVVAILPPDFEEKENDWIGVFKENFSALDRYKAYEYTGRDEVERRRNVNQERRVHVSFSDSVDLKDGQNYVLLYFQSTGTRGINAVIGISEPFGVDRSSKSPIIEEFD